MFTQIAEAQEVNIGLFADLLKDENGNVCLALHLDSDVARGNVHGNERKVALVYMYEDNIFHTLQNIEDLGIVRNSSYRFFESWADYCKWFSYNVES